LSSAVALPVVLATVDDFAARAGAERVVVLLDAEPPLMVERSEEEGALAVTQREETRPAAPARGIAPLGLPDLRAVPASTLSANPDTGELEAPLGAVQQLVDSVLALARVLGGRSVATATFPTRDPDTPLTIAAREGEPVVLEIAGRHFTFPASP
jgi:hypothetical protein